MIADGDDDGEVRLMAQTYAVGDLVTLLPPFDNNEPSIVRHQPHGRVVAVLPAEAGQAQYMVELLAAHPPGRHFGPYPACRLNPGFRVARS